MALRVGIFADDIGATHAAAMVGNGLSRVDRSVMVVAPGLRPGHASRMDRVGDVSVVVPPRRNNAFEIHAALERSQGRNADCVMALPLTFLREHAVRLQFDAVLTVGRERHAADRALRATRYVSSGVDGTGEAPAWFLACSDQNDLRTRAALRSVRGPSLPFAVRSLPAPLPRLGSAEGAALLEGRLDGSTARGGILLAASVVAVAADPHASCIDAATLVRLMATRDLTAERETSDLLVGLAEAYDALEAGMGERTARHLPCGPTSARRLPPARRKPVATRKQADERDAARDRSSRSEPRR